MARVPDSASSSAADAPTPRRGWPGILSAGAILCLGGLLGLFGIEVARRAHFEAPAPTPILYDRHGAFLAQLGHETVTRDGTRRVEYGYWIAAPPPERIVRATLALEDRRFWRHPGVDPFAAARALWQDLANGRRHSGASTIAMQVARMQHPAPRTLWTKAVEAATAVVLTLRYGRGALLAQYLRLAPYANGSHGVAHAARWYFDKPVADLSWAEVALLAAIPQAPGATNPMKPSGRARAIRRGRRALELLAREEIIDGETYARAAAELDGIRLPSRPRRPDALHAILRIARAVTEAPAAVDPADPRIRTTLDLELEAAASRLARRQLRAWKPAGPQQIAVLLARRDSREVLATVGSAGYGIAPGGAIDFTRVSRSPGSTLKPFIFALALAHGRLSPADIMDDLPEGTAGISNADRNFLGPLLPRQALANSRNVPAANLLRRVGLDSGFEFFRDLGLHRLDAPAQSFGLSMAIGSLPTSLDRLLRAYGVLADEGMLRDLIWFEGQRAAPARRLLPADVARQVTLFLSDPMARLPSFPRYGATELPFAAALKTGTSQGYRDAWTVAWSQRYLVGVWVGRADAGTMRDVTGAGAAAGLARALLLRLHEFRPGDLSDTGFAPPSGHVPVELCVFTGRHSARGCSQTLVEWLPTGAAPAPSPAAEFTRAAGKTAVAITPTERAWAKANGLSVDETAAPASGSVRLSIASPEQDAHLWRNPEVPAALDRLALRAVVAPHLAQIVWYVDDEPFAVADPDQTVYWPMRPGVHRFRIGRPFDTSLSKPVRIVVE
jgi:penicillin-binding protein 1C